MKTMPISEFKTHALQVLAQVAETKESVVVTRRGKPLAEVVPFSGFDETPVPGKLSDALVFEEDIVSVMGETIWNACT